MMHRLALAAALVACSSAPEATQPPLFIAVPSDFAAYASWTHFDDGNTPDPEGVDLAGDRTTYINRLPPHGATHFPVGTILVKVVQSDPSPDRWQTFALVKRGDNFDADGAPGWEWFGLDHAPDGHLVIVWRGTGPPPDGGYGGLSAAVGCVFCHASAAKNDYVQTPALQLSLF